MTEHVLTSPAAIPTVAVWLNLLVLAPVLEEVVFRAGLQQALHERGWPAPMAIGLSALVFAGAHLLLRGADWLMAATVLPAWIVGWVYARWRRLWPCITLHAVFNLAWGLRPSGEFF